MLHAYGSQIDGSPRHPPIGGGFVPSGTHSPSRHTYPSTQCPSSVHDVRHFDDGTGRVYRPCPHTYGWHFDTFPKQHSGHSRHRTCGDGGQSHSSYTGTGASSPRQSIKTVSTGHGWFSYGPPTPFCVPEGHGFTTGHSVPGRHVRRVGTSVRHPLHARVNSHRPAPRSHFVAPSSGFPRQSTSSCSAPDPAPGHASFGPVPALHRGSGGQSHPHTCGATLFSVGGTVPLQSISSNVPHRGQPPSGHLPSVPSLHTNLGSRHPHGSYPGSAHGICSSSGAGKPPQSTSTSIVSGFAPRIRSHCGHVALLHFSRVSDVVFTTVLTLQVGIGGDEHPQKSSFTTWRGTCTSNTCPRQSTGGGASMSDRHPPEHFPLFTETVTSATGTPRAEASSLLRTCSDSHTPGHDPRNHRFLNVSTAVKFASPPLTQYSSAARSTWSSTTAPPRSRPGTRDAAPPSRCTGQASSS
eukprot:Sspe_Gene.1195::Locus_405_Transcript_1_3_Confidence_0.714_Length_7052::g.1195::m.1195